MSTTPMSPPTPPRRPGKHTPDNITAVIPAHNEAAGIAATITSLRSQGVHNIVVACDNCTDNTAAIAEREGAYVLTTVDNTARKAGALNQALNHLAAGAADMAEGARLALAMDADTILEPGWVDEALRVLNGRPDVGAVGAIFQADLGTGWLRRCQALEWHRFARECDRTGKTFVLSGTAALIRWEALEDVRDKFAPVLMVPRATPSGVAFHGGREPEWYDPRAITEDFDFTVRLKRCGWELRSPDKCRTTTETMPTVGDLFRQRRRWSLGALQTVKRHGFNAATRIYWFQQFMLLLSIFAMTLLAGLTVYGLAAGGLTLSPFWCLVGLVFAVERVVTVWDRPARDRLFAALVLPELAYALILQAAHVAALAQFVTGSNGTWDHIQKKGN